MAPCHPDDTSLHQLGTRMPLRLANGLYFEETSILLQLCRGWGWGWEWERSCPRDGG